MKNLHEIRASLTDAINGITSHRDEYASRDDAADKHFAELDAMEAQLEAMAATVDQWMEPEAREDLWAK